MAVVTPSSNEVSASNETKIVEVPQNCPSSDGTSTTEELPDNLPFRYPIRHASRMERVALHIKIALGRKIFPRINGLVYRIDRKRLLKCNTQLTLTEVLTMDYVSRNTSIPIPRILDVFLAPEYQGKVLMHVVMEFIPGVELEVVWKRMPMEERRDIMLQLRGYLSQLRRLKPPHPGAVEAIYGRPCQTRFIRYDPFGPFPTVQDFHTFLGTKYVQDHSDKFDEKDILDKTATRTYATAFTHGDIAPRNILVKNKKIVAILDWESAGWYPEYWEYTRTFMANLYIPDFWEMFRTDGLEVTYPDEFIMDQTTANRFFQG
ncbi:kinase-like domain-containing protein [Gautieria morchelliformis]|nr:kinase-like domain-containing protein [Gautieria morchelliformis]